MQSVEKSRFKPVISVGTKKITSGTVTTSQKTQDKKIVCTCVSMERSNFFLATNQMVLKIIAIGFLCKYLNHKFSCNPNFWLVFMHVLLCSLFHPQSFIKFFMFNEWDCFFVVTTVV